MNSQANKSVIITLIVISQFACTSLWFAGNAVISDIQQYLHIESNLTGYIITSVQFGFITGTLISSFFTISDRFSPSKIFFASAIAGAVSNLGIYYFADGFSTLILFRFFTGVFLAGIYPVGMKIASDYSEKGLGKALGFLVGALVLGTAFPHLLKSISQNTPWKYMIIFISLCSVMGGTIILLFVPDGPFRKKSNKMNFGTFIKVFRNKNFRSAAFGYFGHMWELYAFWTFIPLILNTFHFYNPQLSINISLISFFAIAIGGVGCVTGGYLSLKFGNAKVAFFALLISGMCCLISPLLFQMNFLLFMGVIFLWGMTVVADSPQFSTLVAETAPKDSIGTALTIVNSIGFSITILSIQMLSLLQSFQDSKYIYTILLLGPVAGLYAMLPLLRIHNLKNN